MISPNIQIYQFITKTGNKIHELTSSHLNVSKFPGEENGPLRIGPTYTDINFGLIIVSTQTTFSVEN